MHALLAGKDLCTHFIQSLYTPSARKPFYSIIFTNSIWKNPNEKALSERVIKPEADEKGQMSQGRKQKKGVDEG